MRGPPPQAGPIAPPPASTDDNAINDYVHIFDTTLRDGEQAPGCAMTTSEKMEVAEQLARLGVDVIEAGFPAASAGDADAVRAIAAAIGGPDGPIICGLARASEADIDACWAAVAVAARPRIHTFLATSDIHLQHKLRLTRAQVLDAIERMVAYAAAHCADVEFSPEDAGRSDPEFLYDVLRAAVASGATTLNIPDTVGYTTPEEYYALIAGVRANVAGTATAGGVVLSTHCHDDLGLAVANSMAGIRAGARQVECAMNGLGERAGNASLEECVMVLRTRRQAFGVDTRVNTRELVRTSRLVARCTGVAVPPNKAIVGANAFAHAAGIHQHGMLRNPLTYEIMDAASVGADASSLVLGKHSGRHAFRSHLEHLGYTVSDEELTVAFRRFKEAADLHKIVPDSDIVAFVEEALSAPATYLQISSAEHAPADA